MHIWKNLIFPSIHTLRNTLFKFWVFAAVNTHRIPEKEIAKCFVSGLKPDKICEEIYSRSCEHPSVDVMAETKHELSYHRDIIEISERI